jgi:hypothetical protein
MITMLFEAHLRPNCTRSMKLGKAIRYSNPNDHKFGLNII